MLSRYFFAVVVTALVLTVCTGTWGATLNVPGAYSTIQSAIAAAANGDEVVVAAGTYHERISFNGKAITVRSTDPTNPAVVAATVINGDKLGSVVTFNHNETAAAVISGFTITNGSGSFDSGAYTGGGIFTIDASPTIAYNNVTGNAAQFGGGIWCHNGSPIITGNVVSANSVIFSGGGIYTWYATSTISNNIIIGNTADYWGGGIHIEYGGGSVINNTMRGNAANRYYGAGITAIGAAATIRNTIITSAPSGGGVCINAGSTIIKYCDVYGNNGGNYYTIADQTGTNGNISVDPLFSNVLSGDFHLKSIAGRWNGTGWVSDAVCSPCVDAGDPTSAFDNEPQPNGGRINMGADGNTPFASKTGNTPIVLYALSGQITDKLGHGMQGVSVTAGNLATSTDVDGNYAFSNLDSGTYTVTPNLSDYSFTPASTDVTLTHNMTHVNFVGDRRTYTVAGHVATTSHVAVPGATLTLGALTTTSGPDGAFSFSGLFSGHYTLTAALTGYTFTPLKRNLLLDPTSGDISDADFTAIPPSAPPVVVFNAPSDEGVNAEMPVISAIFSTTMIRNSAQAAFSISPTRSDYDEHSWPGTFSWLDNTMRFKLSTSLAPHTTYTVTISTAAHSTRGLPMEQDFVWTFTTGGLPAVAGYAPTGTAVPLNASGRAVKIRFNETMNHTATQNALYIYPAGTVPSAGPQCPPGTFSWVGNTMCYTFTHSLDPLTTYCVKLARSARSSESVWRTIPFSWSFTTGPTPTLPANPRLAAAPTANGAQITISLDAAADVTVSVCNIAGRTVATLHPGQLPAGVHPLLWNGMSANGTHVPSGTYLLQVQAASADGGSTSAMGSVSMQ